MIAMTPQLDRLVAQIAKSLVDDPENVRVKIVESNHTVVLELRVAKEDVGKVIGRQGRTAHAMRVLIGAAASKIKKHTILEILE